MWKEFELPPYVPPTETVTRAFRAQVFANQATRLELQAARLLTEAKEYRARAERLNPTTWAGVTNGA